MKRFVIVGILFLTMVSFAYGQALQDVTAAVQDKATTVAKDKATAYVDDATLTADVKLKLTDLPSLKDADISVSTTEGVVSLTGTVKTKQAKGAATKAAKAVKGVKSVDNKLTIEKPVKKAKGPAK